MWETILTEAIKSGMFAVAMLILIYVIFFRVLPKHEAALAASRGEFLKYLREDQRLNREDNKESRDVFLQALEKNQELQQLAILKVGELHAEAMDRIGHASRTASETKAIVKSMAIALAEKCPVELCPVADALAEHGKSE